MSSSSVSSPIEHPQQVNFPKREEEEEAEEEEAEEEEATSAAAETVFLSQLVNAVCTDTHTLTHTRHSCRCLTVYS